VDAADTGAHVEAAAAGDARAWRALVDQFSGLVWSVARGYGLAAADAEEVYQTAWLRLAEHLDRLKEPAKVGGWLATTARHESLRLIRARARTTLVGDPELLADRPDERSPEQVMLESENARAEVDRLRQVWHAFQRLSERCRRLLRVLMASPPPSYTDVSAALGMPIGSIGPTRARCLARLRELMAGGGYDS
jgi:RNA polymerase sigma factor (sigma-70 family)